MTELSRVRNAARDVADSFLRFERDMARLQRVCKEAGGVDSEIVRAINQGCDSEARRTAFLTIHSRLESGSSGTER